ncbi:MAG TPA: NAD(P)-binding domain-containing protein [Mycobacteriales bacterium]|nr:NAD(P)-binding domain-containing protein [Mycobacteriales bacterium]
MTTTATVLGLGPMGTALASALLAAGHPTTVWNRTAAKAEPLIRQGAVTAATAAEAVRTSELVIVCLLDYAAAQAVLESALPTTVINLSSGSPDEVREMAVRAESRGIAYLDGAILTPTPSIGTPAAMTLYSGPESLYRKYEETLAAFGPGRYVGAEVGRAAALDTAVLDLFWSAVTGMTHAFALAAAENIAPHEIVPYAQGISALLPEMLARFADHINAGEHPGDRSTITSAAAGLDHIIRAARARGIDTGTLRAGKRIIDRAIDHGYGADGLSRLATLQQDYGV